MSSQDILQAAAQSAAPVHGETQANPEFKGTGLTWCPTWSTIPCKCMPLSSASGRYFRYLCTATQLPHVYAAQRRVLLLQISIMPH